jgi:hypothetical protein
MTARNRARETRSGHGRIGVRIPASAGTGAFVAARRTPRVPRASLPDDCGAAP